MITDEFSDVRSDAIREELIDWAAQPARRGRRIALVAGLALAGALAGGGAVSAAAGIWSAPGAPVVALFGDPETFAVDGSARDIPLDPPDGATHVRVTITCTSAGTTSWGLDPSGNNPTSSCSALDVGTDSATGWMDFRLDGATTLYVRPQGGARSTVSVQYLQATDTDWGVNDNGETYGVTKPDGGGDPDLILASGVDFDGAPLDGYVRDAELLQQCPGAPMPQSPEQAGEQQTRCDQEYPSGWDVPLYESDGVTQIGWFHVG